MKLTLRIRIAWVLTRTNFRAGKLNSFFWPTAWSVSLSYPGALSLVWGKHQPSRAVIQVCCSIITEEIFITILMSKVSILPGTVLARTRHLELLTVSRAVNTEWVATLTSTTTRVKLCKAECWCWSNKTGVPERKLWSVSCHNFMLLVFNRTIILHSWWRNSAFISCVHPL